MHGEQTLEVDPDLGWRINRLNWWPGLLASF
jgi:hypothetical protein